MRSAKLLAATAAFAGYASAASTSTCTSDIEVSEATPSIDCEVVKGDITVNESVAGNLLIDGPKQIKGDLIINNATEIISIQSNTINAIGGTLRLQSLTTLNTITLSSLTTVNDLLMETLPALRELTFGSDGVTKASSVQISDTFLSSLSGLKLTTVDTLNINNNDRLTKFESSLVNITTELVINNNGRDMEITMNDLESASEVQIANVKTFEVPLLTKVNASLKFDSCDELESFTAPNLTEITDALSFINNEQLTNISFPELTTIGGDLRIVNNTELTEINGFPELESVATINMGGNFEEIKMPSLDSVSGTVAVSTTTKNDSICDVFNSVDDDGGVRGESSCTYDNDNANEGGDSDGGSSSDGSSSSGDGEDAAGIVGVNTALMGLALLAGFAQLL